MKYYFIFCCALLIIIFFSTSCDTSTNPDTDDNIAGLIEGETSKHEISKNFNGNDLSFDFGNGIEFNLYADDNTSAPEGDVTVFIIENERYFNTNKDVVFDFSRNKHPYVFEFVYQLPKNLETEDIGLFLYSPSSSEEELDGYELNFDYNKESGKLSAKFSAPAESNSQGSVEKISDVFQSGNGKYSRLTLSWSIRAELAEGAKSKIIKMPYYEQAGNTCWAACAKMMGRAYSTINDKERKIRIYEIVKYMGHSNFDEGLGIYGFKRNIPRYLNLKTGIEYETSSFLMQSSLRNEIKRKLDNDQPVILNLTYPNVGKHQILVVGYELDIVSIGKTTFKLLYHNPQNTDNESLYRWADFDWLMKEKWSTELVQILYANRSVPESRPLQTIATPIFDKPLMDGGQSLGELSFNVRRVTAAGEIANIPIHQVYSENNENGYIWVMRSQGAGEIEVMPDTTAFIELTQPIYNADENTRNLELSIEAFDLDSYEMLYSEQEPVSLKPGNNKPEFYIPLDEFYDKAKQRNIRMVVQLNDGYDFLDGYSFDFKLEPRITVEIDFFFTFKIDVTTLSTLGDKERESEGEMYMIVPGSIPLKGDGKTFSGVLERSVTSTTSERYEVSVSYDNIDYPTSIENLKLNKIEKIVLSGNTSTYTTQIELSNISFTEDEVSSFTGLSLNREGTQVCGFITNLQSKSRHQSDGIYNTDLIDYNCNSKTELEIKLWNPF